jgi:OmpA-OmpF porin, OOP family
MKHTSMLSAVLLIGASSVFAQTPAPAPSPVSAPAWGTYPKTPWYIGGGAGVGHLDRSASDLTGLNNATLDDNDTSWTVRGGWRFSPYAAVELGYYDFGRYNFTGTAVGNAVPVEGSGKAHSVILSLVGIIPINTVDLYGRIGWAYSELKFNANGPINTANENERQDEAAYGLGARWWFAPNWGVFAEWAKNDRIRVDSYVAGIDFRF